MFKTNEAVMNFSSNTIKYLKFHFIGMLYLHIRMLLEIHCSMAYKMNVTASDIIHLLIGLT